MNYLICQWCSWSLRMVVPDDLRPAVGKCELRYTVCFGDKQEAKSKSKRISR
jgi:hypothetical protein